jgi:predicted RNA binding protein YcfA (HicA-like mRNA interferase family)
MPRSNAILIGIQSKDHERYNAAMPVKVKEAIQFIERDGWAQVRQTGNHRHFHHPSKPGTVTIAGHPSDVIYPKTLAKIKKQAGSNEICSDL